MLLQVLKGVRTPKASCRPLTGIRIIGGGGKSRLLIRGDGRAALWLASLGADNISVCKHKLCSSGTKEGLKRWGEASWGNGKEPFWHVQKDSVLSSEESPHYRMQSIIFKCFLKDYYYYFI